MKMRLKNYYNATLRFLIFSCIIFQLNTLLAQPLNEIRNIRAGKHDNFYRVVLETSKKVEAIVKLKDNPYRAIITIPESLWRVGSSPRRGNFQSNIPLSYAFRNDEFDKTNLTLKIDKPFSLDKIFWLPGANGGERLVIDIYYSSETDFIVTQKSFNDFSKEQLNIVLREKPEIKKKEVVLFEGQKQKNLIPKNKNNLNEENISMLTPLSKPVTFLVVIDPGHGGKDPGAIGFSKTLEKDINLYASKILQAKLNKINGVKAVLTRTEDNFVSLHDRYKIANQLKADIFISLHSDSAKSKTVSGYSIFSLNKDPDLEIANFQKNSNNQNVLGNVILDEEIQETQNVLYKMYQRRKRNYSIKLKNLILEELKSLPTNSRGWKEKNFAVLKSPVIPSVLIEMGFLSNKIDEKNLNNPIFISNLMDRISMAVSKYKNVYMN